MATVDILAEPAVICLYVFKPYIAAQDEFILHPSQSSLTVFPTVHEPSVTILILMLRIRTIPEGLTHGNVVHLFCRLLMLDAVPS